jgi:hypothetical protein
MALEQLDPAQWKAFFDRVSKELGAKQVEIEVAGLDIGDEIEAEWIPFTGVSYDPKDNVLSIFSDRMEHMIHKPREIWVDFAVDGLHSMEVVDADDRKQIILLKDDLALPAPNA